METTPTWLEVAHRAGSRFVFIVLSCTSLCNISDTPPPTSHTRAAATTTSSTLLHSSLVFSILLRHPWSQQSYVLYPATHVPSCPSSPANGFLVSTVFQEGAAGGAPLPVSAPSGGLSVAQGGKEWRSSREGRRSKQFKIVFRAVANL